MPSPAPDLPGCQPLAGQLVVFTGKLSSLGRKDARALVARLGGATSDDVNAKTTMLVVGAEGFGSTPEPTGPGDVAAADLSSASGDSPGSGLSGTVDPPAAADVVSGFSRTVGPRTPREKSNKLKRVEELNAQHGLRIQIVSEE